MVELNYAHICEYATLSRGNKPVLVSIFSNVSEEELPALVRDMYFVAFLEIDDDQTHSIKIKFKTPSGDNLLDPYTEEVERQEDERGYGIMLNVGSVSFKEKGSYKIEIYSDEELIGKKKLLVEIDN